ncbi:MAG TPA: methylenetetrahydrofolate--tRNA-(uracil(54)-C(5))-methyltransferase (FADH(2)-oxidizing) TrmFO [Candidatus Krumholzibacteria bacterium]|nr:methylenetetrahydrofolate--tRNA-(uracil(54)-C(5))-methyltransferase (FADH(2)-oxidizing) TrmFO [Candidatus Krumholzibacteria bacterium]HPD71588.1 methylenetetrahydrofolate--tRNA-(uracil(54)-C(5))-methyltransferase (FADH(2)-oxidizing) TrmFO [Candidatus Krumholzibacteria bacterium]HRY41479.1 methylenetetrahydrofolate--tRNA-(uracil(54)-C(5))-methyltransferase (FADH(2)-oxidizing) TrmFO [Candidatus Krumholzibacteria bacterium]
MAAPEIRIVGGGLAGCEAALQLARRGRSSTLYEMRPTVPTPAHRSGCLAELVCSNSLKSADPATASGLLKEELDRLGCELLPIARACAVPAGAALAVDRERFAAAVEARIAAEPLITVRREEVGRLEAAPGRWWILASGPLTSPALQDQIGALTGQGGLHFFDAIAPTVTRDSLDLGRLYRASRYAKGEADYLNAALDEGEYRAFREALVAAERIPVKDFDRADLFEGCQPIEEIAESGPQSLCFGPLRPVGLNLPDGRRAHAVVQLRQENAAGTLWGLVGFQTRLRWGDQERVFRMIPGLERAEFVRLGQMHRNFYVDSPRVLRPDFALRAEPAVRLAGQITGVEGYVESIAGGLVTAWHLDAALAGRRLPPWPYTTIIGALHHGFLFDDTAPRLAPMNANFGLLPELDQPVKGKRERKLAQRERALADLEFFLRLVAEDAGAVSAAAETEYPGEE